MSFIINQNFALKSPQFNFARDYFANLADLKAASESDFPDHFITNVAGDLYQLTKSNSVDSNTGKWRKVKLGSDVNLSGYATTASLNSHTTDKNNPHGVTKSQVGLSNVDNTSDKAKPISIATQNALDTKASKSELDVVKREYATKTEISALTSALVYKGTVDAKYALPTKNVKVGDVYVVAAAGTFAGQTCEPGDMIIAQTASNAEGTPAPTWTVVQTNINGAVTSTDALADNTLVLGNNNRAIKASSGNGFVKVANGVVSYDNNVVTASATLDSNRLVVGSGGKGIHVAGGTGFVKIADGIVSADNSTYLKSVPNATTTAVGGGKVVNVHNATAELTNTDPTASNVTLYGLQIDKDGNFYTPVKNAATYSLPAAADGKLGGIALGYSQTGKNYAVKLDSDNKAYVNVPWTDNNTTYPLASASTNGLMSKDDKSKLDDLALSGNSFNEASTSTKGLRLNLVGTDSSYDIPIVKPSSDASTYGLMNGTDKQKLDGIAANATRVLVDSTLSDSNNAIKNSAVNTAIKEVYKEIATVGNKVDNITSIPDSEITKLF